MTEPVEDRNPRFTQLVNEMINLHERKNAGYAGHDQNDPLANFRLAAVAGVLPSTGCLIRMGDKFARLGSLARQASNEQVGESPVDTARDLAVYALLYICLWEEEQEPTPVAPC